MCVCVALCQAQTALFFKCVLQNELKALSIQLVSNFFFCHEAAPQKEIYTFYSAKSSCSRCFKYFDPPLIRDVYVFEFRKKVILK